MLAIVLSSCASGPPAPRLTECLTDPSTPGKLFCDGIDAPWGQYVCHPLDEHEEYRRRCQ